MEVFLGNIKVLDRNADHTYCKGFDQGCYWAVKRTAQELRRAGYTIRVHRLWICGRRYASVWLCGGAS